MLDVNFIINNPKKVKENMRKKGYPNEVKIVDGFIQLDEKRRKLQEKIDNLRAKLNTLGRKGQKPTQDEIEKAKKQKKDLKELEDNCRTIYKKWHELHALIPNMMKEDTPLGNSEEKNVEIKAWIPNSGYVDKSNLGLANPQPKYVPQGVTHGDNKCKPVHHIEIGERLGIIDTKQASQKVSGSRFYYLIGDGVLLEWAIFQLLSNYLLKKGFIPMIVPLLVREKALFGTSHFPRGRDQMYKIESFNIEDERELYLVGSTEPSLFAYHMDKTLHVDQLPFKMMAFSSCFRSEAGSWGKDVRGIKRVHQFDKLEMDVVCHPDDSEKIMWELLDINEWLLQQLELPYRIVRKCCGDSGYDAAYEQYDPEVWCPGQQAFMEFGTATNTTDYQARRLNIKYKDEKGKHYVHTVNNTGFTTRTVIAILENYLQSDGSVLVPKVLQPYLGKEKIKNT